MRSQLLRPEWMLPADRGFCERSCAIAFCRMGPTMLAQVMYFEATANLTGDMLVKVDRMSMAASLEVRCPLLDHELAELAATIPHAWKIRNGRGKDILIDALGDRLPPELLNRPKMGFGVPLADWFRGPLRPILRDHLESQRFFARDIVSPSFVRALIAEHESRRRNNTTWLWSLLMLEMWFRRQEAAKDTGTAEPVYR